MITQYVGSHDLQRRIFPLSFGRCIYGRISLRQIQPRRYDHVEGKRNNLEENTIERSNIHQFLVTLEVANLQWYLLSVISHRAKGFFR